MLWPGTSFGPRLLFALMGIATLLSFLQILLAPIGGNDRSQLTASDPDLDRRLHLASNALNKVLADAQQVFGTIDTSRSVGASANWMNGLPDSTRIIDLNLPGAHDAASWSWSEKRHHETEGYMGLAGMPIVPHDQLQCQQHSLAEMLDAGVRVFDLRYALDISNSTLNFYHSNAFFGQSSTLDAVMFGFYTWLDQHPSETVLLSFQYEHHTTVNATNDARTQQMLFDVLTNTAAKPYINPLKDEFGTLGDCRGQIVLLRRFDLDHLDPYHETHIPGVHFSPQNWTVNSKHIILQHDSMTAHIEDYYFVYIQDGQATLKQVIDAKYEATVSNLDRAVSPQEGNSFMWSFASGTVSENTPIITPRMLALGGGSTEGMNQRLVDYFDTQKGKRLGVVMFDFYEAHEAVAALLRVQDYI